MTSNRVVQVIRNPTFRTVGCLMTYSLAVGLGIFWGYQLGYLFPSLLPSGFSALTVATLTISIFIALKGKRIEKDRFLAATSYYSVAIGFISALILASSISALAVSGNSSYDRIAGLIPYSDASNYYQQLLDWPRTSFDHWNSRRAFNSVFNIFKFDVGGFGLLNLLFLQVVLATLAVTAFIGLVARQVGAVTATPAAMALLIWTWPFVSSTLSEINGITIALVAFSLYISALQRKHWVLGVLALLAFAMSYAFRPYNPLIVLIMGMGLVYFLKGSTARIKSRGAIAAIVLCLAVFFTSVVPRVPFSFYGHPDGGLNSNTGSVLLGLARGTNWSEAQDFFTDKYGAMPERQANGKMADLAFQTALSNPTSMVKSLARGEAKAIFVTQQEIGIALGFEDHLDGRGNTITTNEFMAYIIKAPSIWITSSFFGLNFVLLLIIFRYSIISKLSVLSLFTLFSFAPIVFMDGGWRVAATLYPGIALLVLGIPLYLQKRNPKDLFDHNLHNQKLLLIRHDFCLLLALSLLIVFISSLIYPNVAKALNMKRYQPLVVVFTAGDSSRWIGPNQAVADPSTLVKWAGKEKNHSLVALFERYESRIRTVSFTLDRGPLLTISGGDISENDRASFKQFGFGVTQKQDYE